MAKIPKVTVTFDADLDSLKKGVKGATTEVDSFGSKVGDFSKKAALAFAAVAAAAAGMALKIGVDAVKAASDLSETISKVNVLFGDTAADIEKFAEGAATALGQTKQQALDAAATFATFGKSAGLSGKDLGKFSTDFVKLASDLASFNNTTPEQAINAIGSALRGEAEPLRAYGVLLDDASLRQSALSLGIIKTTKEALTPQQKVLAAQALIYQQTGAAQGDFERTSDGLANKTRILTAQLENAQTTIGTALLPIVLELATFFSDKVIPIVQQVSEAFSSNADGLSGTLSNIDHVIKSFVQPIFEAFKNQFDKIKATIIENKDEFESFFRVVKAAAPIIGSVIGKAFSLIGDIANVVLNIMANVIGALEGLVNKAIALINIAIRGFNLLKPGDDVKPINPINPNTPNPPNTPTKSRPPTIPNTTNTPDIPDTPIISTKPNMNFEVDNSGDPTGTNALNKVTKKTKEVITDIAGAFDNFTSGTTTLAGIMAASNKAFAFGTSGANTSSLAGIMAASNAPTINLTVNGALDKEGTARTIVDTLNNSFYRGTGGAGNLVLP